jgi:hypothetical protein
VQPRQVTLQGFHENKKLNLKLESSFSEIASLRSMHDDMSTKPCDNYKMIMVTYADLWIVHSQVASLLDGTKLKLREHKALKLHLYVASSWRSHGDEVGDGRVDATGYIKLFYPNFVVFFVLGHKGNLVISFSYK